MPGDLMVGAYWPWLERIPVKNPIISDVFSQIYIWKSLVAESYRHFQWPLWNPYSYSGYPLLANFQSAAFSPLNLFLILLGDHVGWTALIIFGVLGSLVSMYFLLRVLGYQKNSSVVGAVSYAFSGYAMVSMEFATASQVLVWIPWLFILIERKKYLNKLPIIIFLIITSGHFQGMVYSLSLASIYFIYRFQKLKYWIVFVTIGLFLSAAQLLPTLELFKYAVRSGENYISHYNYGLFPISQLVTLIAPDFFGNPVTRNYWGFWNYHETTIYLGIFSLLALVFSIYDWRKLKNGKFFLITALVSLLLALDTPIGRLVYFLNIPGLSTSGGGRIIMLFTFASGVLTAYAYQNINTLKKFWGVIVTFGVIIGMVVILKFLHIENMTVALRNLVYPIIILSGFMLAIRYFKTGILIIVIFDLFKFGWKYNPFVKPNLVFPKTQSIELIKDKIGFARMDREKGEIMPPNTWAAYRFMSPSGYDPLAISDYVLGYQRTVNDNPHASPSRYSELEKYDSKALAKFGVKYLWVINNGKKIISPQWKVIYNTETYSILENPDYKNRVYLLNGQGDAQIISYSPLLVRIKYFSSGPDTLVISDSWYPGWQAKIGNTKVDIEKFYGIFKSISVPAGEKTVEMTYNPISFKLGYLITALTFFGFLAYTSKRSPK